MHSKHDDDNGRSTAIPTTDRATATECTQPCGCRQRECCTQQHIAPATQQGNTVLLLAASHSGMCTHTVHCATYCNVETQTNHTPTRSVCLQGAEAATALWQQQPPQPTLMRLHSRTLSLPPSLLSTIPQSLAPSKPAVWLPLLTPLPCPPCSP